MHNLSTSFVLGYHGCDRLIGESLLAGKPFVPSDNSYDWLGPGVYFWESNPERALDWARNRRIQKAAAGIDFEPFVVGAIIDPGFCLDMISSSGIEALEGIYPEYETTMNVAGSPLPRNAGGDDSLLRNLDCDVIRFLHYSRRETGRPALDTVRGVFTEGKPIYPSSGFRRKTHIQICVRNQARIKGVFRVLDEQYHAAKT